MRSQPLGDMLEPPLGPNQEKRDLQAENFITSQGRRRCPCQAIPQWRQGTIQWLRDVEARSPNAQLPSDKFFRSRASTQPVRVSVPRREYIVDAIFGLAGRGHERKLHFGREMVTKKRKIAILPTELSPPPGAKVAVPMDWQRKCRSPENNSERGVDRPAAASLRRHKRWFEGI